MWRHRAQEPLLAFLIVLPVGVGASGTTEVPFLTGRVNDYAEMISPEARDRIAAKAARLEAEDSFQVAVLTVTSLEGEPLEAYSARVGSTWKLGQEVHDRGVLFLIAREERKLRFEIGLNYRFGSIYSNVVNPRFGNV